MADKDQELKQASAPEPSSSKFFPKYSIHAGQANNDGQADSLISTTTIDPTPLTEVPPSIPQLENALEADQEPIHVEEQMANGFDGEASPQAHAQAVLDDPKASTARIEEAVTHLQKAIFFEPLNIK